MKQNLQQIKEITLGAARVTEEADGFHFYRFTEEQEAFYQFRKADYYKKTFSSSGIKLSFRTDSRTLFLKGTLAQGSSRWYYAFDVFVNGTKVDTIDNFSGVTLPADYAGVTLPVGDFEKTFFLGDGEKDVCVYLPWTMKTVLQEVSLDDGAWIQPVRPSKKMLCFGDSITQGYDALYPSNKYITRFAELMGAEEYNKAIGGERFVPGLAALREEFDPDYITVAYGTNDWCHLPREESIYNAQMFFQYLHNYYPNAKIFVITPIWRKAHEEFRVYGKFEEVEQNLRNITERYENVMVISGYSFVEPDEKLFADLCLHPNDAGFDQYFEGLKKRVF